MREFRDARKECLLPQNNLRPASREAHSERKGDVYGYSKGVFREIGPRLGTQAKRFSGTLGDFARLPRFSLGPS